MEEHTDAEIGKKHEDPDVENLMFPDAENPDAETPDAEDSTTPTDVSDYYCEVSAYEALHYFVSAAMAPYFKS